MRAFLIVLSSVVFGGATLIAQDRPLPRLEDGAPLEHPTARGALRGLTICLEEPVRPSDPVAVRAANYLARLFESAGAGVVIASGAPGEGPAQLLEGVGPALSIALVGTSGSVVTGMPPSGRDPVESALLHELYVAGEKVGVVPFAHGGQQADERTVPGIGIGLVRSDEPNAHRAPAHAVFEIVVGWWREHGAVLRERMRASAAVESGDRPLDPNWPLSRAPQTEAEVAAFVDSWRRSRIVDPTQVYVRIDVRRRDDGWQLSGATELPLLEPAARRALERIGVKPLAGSLRLLPDADRLAGTAYGIVTDRAALTWRVSGRATGYGRVDPAGQFEETMVLAGEPVRLLDLDGDHLLVHALSGYLGWLRGDAVERCDEGRFRRCLAEASGRGETPAGSGATAARLALSRLGTPYVFGGRSDEGIDCSGLVGTAWAAQGAFLARDARQQILCGQLVSTARQPAPLEPGDLLFFANGSGQISHVAMSLGGWRFVHATPPEVTVGSLDPDDPFYARVAERFVLSKRVAR